MNIYIKTEEIIKELSGCDSINKTDRLKEDLALDSLEMVTLLISLEDTFAIELDESDMDPYDLITVSDVIELAEKYTEVLQDE